MEPPRVVDPKITLVYRVISRRRKNCLTPQGIDILEFYRPQGTGLELHGAQLKVVLNTLAATLYKGNRN